MADSRIDSLVNLEPTRLEELHQPEELALPSDKRTRQLEGNAICTASLATDVAVEADAHLRSGPRVAPCMTYPGGLPLRSSRQRDELSNQDLLLGRGWGRHRCGRARVRGSGNGLAMALVQQEKPFEASRGRGLGRCELEQPQERPGAIRCGPSCAREI